MNIGIVAPCPSPYTAGGAERLWRGLRDFVNQHTDDHADIIKLPVSEASFWGLMTGYEAFSRLDLSGFDLIVSGKYPAWMVRHPVHVIYMLHPCRGLYEGYRGPTEGWEKLQAFPAFRRLRRILGVAPHVDTRLDELWSVLQEIRRSSELAALVPWPGLVARDVVRYLDAVALQPSRIAKYAAISKQLTAREGYFPVGAAVEIAYPPSALAVEPGRAENYVFTASRLNDYKRVALLVEAMRHVNSGVGLKVAGDGPELQRLRAKAERLPAIEFLGYRSDTELADLYAKSKAVAFVPYQEDYGLIVVEAMMAAKPIITTIDAGGPAELVVDGESGRVVDPEPKALAAAIDAVVADVDERREMGRRAHAFQRAIHWQAVCDTLFSLPDGGPAGKPGLWGRRGFAHIVVVSTFHVFPPRHGGQIRSFHLYANLAKWFDVTIVAIVDHGSERREQEIAPGLKELCLPKSAAHDKKEKALFNKIGIPINDVSVLEYWPLSPDLVVEIEAVCKGAAAVVASHPYSLPMLRKVSECPLWYEAQDVEWEIKKQILSDSKSKLVPDLTRGVKAAEQGCCDQAEVVLVCSDEDASMLNELYACDPGKIIVAPNGTDVGEITFYSPQERRAARAPLFDQPVTRPMILFMGSGHHPNLEAVKRIFEFSQSLPDAAFVVMGSSCYAFDPQMKPENVWFVGEVSNTERLVLMEIVDIAINPMRSGSGTNLKMVDYLAAGLPTISSPMGIRGLGAVDGEHCLVAELADFPQTIKKLLADEALQERLSTAGRAFVEERYDWSSIAGHIYEHLPAGYRPSETIVPRDEIDA